MIYAPGVPPRSGHRGRLVVSGERATIHVMLGWHPMLATEERAPGVWTMVDLTAGTLPGGIHPELKGIIDG